MEILNNIQVLLLILQEKPGYEARMLLSVQMCVVTGASAPVIAEMLRRL